MTGGKRLMISVGRAVVPVMKQAVGLTARGECWWLARASTSRTLERARMERERKETMLLS